MKPADREVSIPSLLSAHGRWEQSIGGIELVWHRANSEGELDAFLRSDVRWAECDLRVDPGGRIVTSHEPVEPGEHRLELRDWLRVVRSEGRSAKVDLKEGGPVLEAALSVTDELGFDDRDVWFNAAVEIPEGKPGFRMLAEARQGSRLSCPIDTLAAWLLVGGDQALQLLDMLRSWGVNWLCFGAEIPALGVAVRAIQERGWPVNIWDVANGPALDRAIAAHPESITADLATIRPG
jgi:hypothetical protein